MKKIRELKEYFPNHIIGYSDHTLPQEMIPCVSAALLGAKIIEKHFTFDKTMPGNDHYHAMDVNDLKRLNEILDKVKKLIGNEDYKKPIKSEFLSRKNARRSIVLNSDLNKGSQLKAENLTYKRPGTGISPLHWDEVIGKSLKTNLLADHILQWKDLI